MQHRGWMIAGWAVATVLAVVLGLQGVRAVSDSVTDDRRPSLSPARVRAALDGAPASSSSASSSASTESGSSASSASPDGDPASASSVSSSNGSDGGGVDGGGDTVVLPPPASSSSDDEGSEDSSSSAATSEVIDETYELVGGTVSVRFENGTARVLWASPAPGFVLENNGGGSDVDVRFRSDDHESRLRAFWDNGPQHTVEEKND